MNDQGRDATLDAIRKLHRTKPESEVDRFFSAGNGNAMLKTTAERNEDRAQIVRNESMLRGGDTLRKGAMPTAQETIRKIQRGESVALPAQSSNGQNDSVTADDGADGSFRDQRMPSILDGLVHLGGQSSSMSSQDAGPEDDDADKSEIARFRRAYRATKAQRIMPGQTLPE